MGYLRKKMNVICRTAREEQIYREIATREGFTWRGGKTLLEQRNVVAPCAFQIDYFGDGYVTYVKELEYKMPENFTTVEASDLFHNELIARRIKYGDTT